MEDQFKKFGNSIDRLINGENLSRPETSELFGQILTGRQSDIHQGAFLAAITAKGPTPEEIAGAWEAIYHLDTAKVNPAVDQPLVDNCGTGMDAFKTFNISTGASIVAAAGGVVMARHGARAMTSKCGTVDLCEALGVDVECESDVVKKSIETAGIGLFNGMSPAIHPQALFRILSQMCFGSILNIAASLANPANPRLGVRGVYAPEMVRPVAETMLEMGFEKAVVFHGTTGNGNGGMDELSPFSESHVAEIDREGIKRYSLNPQAVGMTEAPALAEIAGGSDLRQEALRLLAIFAGRDRGGRYETICLNTAPIFYVAGEVDDLKQGVEKARAVIDDGRALKKLHQWVSTQATAPALSSARLDGLLNELN